MTYLNPSPVVLGLVPVGEGLLSITRGIDPHIGFEALPGGYVDLGETWQEGLVREVREEAHVELDPKRFTVFAVHSSHPNPMHVLIFGIYQTPLKEEDLPPFTVTSETLNRKIVYPWDAQEWAFPIHNLVVQQYFQPRFQIARDVLARAEADLAALREFFRSTTSPIERLSLESRIPEMERRVQEARERLERFTKGTSSC